MKIPERQYRSYGIVVRYYRVWGGGKGRVGKDTRICADKRHC